MQRPRIRYSLILTCSFIALYPLPAAARVVEQIIAVLDGEPYTLSNFQDYAKTHMGRDFPKGDLNQLEKEDKEVLEQFITEKLLAAEVKLAGIRVSEEDVDHYVDQIKEKNQINDEQLAAALSREGITLEKYRASIKSQIEKSEIINRQVRKRVNITSEDVERYYRLNQKRYVTEERVRLRHILLSLPEGSPREREREVMSKAAEVRKRAMAGENFATLAESYSEGAGASEGGDIGWLARASLLKEIEEIAFNKLSVGEVSQPVRTSLGLHMIKLEQRDGGQPLPFPQVQAKIKEELIAKALEERFQKWLKADLRRKHRVDVKIPGVVFRPEDTQEGTMDSLVASSSRRIKNEQSGFFSYLNPFSYIFTESSAEDDEEDSEKPHLAGQSILSLFGTPLFRTYSTEDVPDDPLEPLDGPKGSADKPQESGGFFSSIWKTLNPFSKDR
jgi:peptidyl-prolyl cis-trans isomerase SurA